MCVNNSMQLVQLMISICFVCLGPRGAVATAPENRTQAERQRQEINASWLFVVDSCLFVTYTLYTTSRTGGVGDAEAEERSSSRMSFVSSSASDNNGCVETISPSMTGEAELLLLDRSRSHPL
mmetsp:Transcript_46023/g.68511  ORF Transcript_46023/g.68511 Transcript_46023/m.68511 type:complete len:123 (+) Transcript_46023:12-380(+)